MFAVFQKTLRKNLKLHQLILFVVANLLLVSCGTYQSAYNNDGIYGDETAIKENKEIVSYTKNYIICTTSAERGTKVISNYCIACDKNISKTKPQYCDFCGSRACEKCMYKQREF